MACIHVYIVASHIGAHAAQTEQGFVLSTVASSPRPAELFAIGSKHSSIPVHASSNHQAEPYGFICSMFETCWFQKPD